jgi:CheY-like chemotaxis protein
VHTIFLDVQYGVDEKLSALKLENETSCLLEGYCFSFTVVPDPLIALECTETTAFDIIFMSEDSQMGISALALLRSLRMVGSTLPIVLMKNGSNSNSDELAAQSYHAENGMQNASFYSKHNANLKDLKLETPTFSNCLRKPFTKRDLCDVLRCCLFPASPRQLELQRQQQLRTVAQGRQLVHHIIGGDLGSVISCSDDDCQSYRLDIDNYGDGEEEEDGDLDYIDLDMELDIDTGENITVGMGLAPIRV